MRATSRESYVVVKAALDAYASSADSGQVLAVADELLAVTALLRDEPRLRRALADATRSEESRVELMRSLLSGKISSEALDLAEVLAAGRWSVPSELLEATERLGVEALLASAESAQELGEVEDELFRFGQIATGDRELVSVLGDSTVEVGRRRELVRQLLDGKARPVTVRLAELAIVGFGGRGFEASLQRLVELAAERRDRAVAYVTTAVVPTEAEEERLTDLLSHRYGRQVSLKVEVRPEIIGGMSVRVGSDLYDGTVLRRLTEARQALSK
jgi:F-type H+-transporting ATPase subunit delta